MLILAVTLLGLLCGSFANVLIARIPAGEGWAKGSSRCPRCRHDIAWYDNIPVLSWMWLRRRCRHCAEPISGRYPLVELSVGALFGLVAWQFGSSAVAWLLAFSALLTVALAAIDLEHHRLPNPLVFAMAGAVLVLLATDAALTGDWAALARAGIGAVALGGFYFVLWFAYPKGLGFGDVKLAVPVGAVLGYLGWGALAVGAIGGPLVGGLLALVASVRAGGVKGVRFAYGPAIIGAFWVAVLWGPAIATWYVDWAAGWAV
ncbi:prepilin peptidase [Demequina maris]|uniref:prepilin peptidase n=1 Tax=Demequina maris TaxID=1638982 RepID=UPI0007860F21|nr:A24 family peptidase [Demequina maris]